VTRVIGVDACKKGWVGVTSDLRGYFGATIDQLVATADGDGELEVVAIDIPIGLPLTGTRQADVLARGLVGKRKSSVFPTPIRSALLATSHAEGSVLNLRATGKGITRQAYGLGKKILEVDDWVRTVDRPVIEVHPEICFATLAGHPLANSKWSWAGAEERRRLLASAGISVPAELQFGRIRRIPCDGWGRPRYRARNNGSADQPLQIWALRDVGSAAPKLATRAGPNRALREPRPTRATCTGADAP
jgi:predicted RNase H-like nuclease